MQSTHELVILLGISFSEIKLWRTFLSQ